MFFKFLQCKLIPCSFYALLLESKLPNSLHSRGEHYTSIPWVENVYKNYLNILCIWNSYKTHFLDYGGMLSYKTKIFFKILKLWMTLCNRDLENSTWPYHSTFMTVITWFFFKLVTFKEDHYLFCTSYYLIKVTIYNWHSRY